MGLSQIVFFSRDYKSWDEATFFPDFAVEGCRTGVFGCYIDFSGFSTSRVNCTQERSLYTTCVTASTARTSKTKIKQGSIHGADI
jgi:hypothetical protein